MRDLVKKPKVLFLIILVAISILAISFNGIEFGIDFKGGTLFQIQLDESVSADKMSTITAIISERLDAFGLKDTKVNSWGEDFVAAQIAETDSDRIEQLESLLRTQGKFEATIDGEILFEGKDILQVYSDAASGYGVVEKGENVFSWQLPFLLNQKAAENFSKKVFHKCSATSFDVEAGTSYDCEQTYFFIDKPKESILIIPSTTYAVDSDLLQKGNFLENIPEETSIEELLTNASLPYIVVNLDDNFSVLELESLNGFAEEKEKAIIHPSVSEGKKQVLLALGFELVEISQADSEIPWVWTVTGARQVIGLTPGITNLEPYVEDESKAKMFSKLLITGSGGTAEEAYSELKALQVLLETGSLPIGIKSISKETISPMLGEEFLGSTLLIGIVALLTVAAVIFIRYRVLELVIPIIITGASETVLILGFASLIHYNLDLAAVAGILAAVGTGVDHQVIITDELLRGEASVSGSLVNRVKKAFFIIFATSSTTIATMLPIILFSFGLGKLKGFAIITVIGVLIGILITRPAFSVMAEYVLKKKEIKE